MTTAMEVEVRVLRDDERAAAGAVAARALASSPIARWIYGDEPVGRIGASLDTYVGYVQSHPDPIGALIGPHVVGVCASAPPGTCVGTVAPEEWRTTSPPVGPPGDRSRQLYAWSLMYRHDLAERHWHLGPVGVEPGLQGAGIGARMLEMFDAQMDDAGEVAWLETDKPENVVFYRRAGWEVANELTEHGLTIWWMRRDPR
jgi:GNAT superfamily N-acetyltransferase